MVDYLLQDSAIESLVGFITQNDSSQPRPSPYQQQGEEMKLAYKSVSLFELYIIVIYFRYYRAVLLLSPDMIIDPLNAILVKKSGVITRKLFDVCILFFCPVLH
jgi:hypothetical protein